MLILGIALGGLFPRLFSSIASWTTSVIKLIVMFVPILIFAALSPACATLVKRGLAGKFAASVVGWFIFSSAIAGLIGVVVSLSIFRSPFSEYRSGLWTEVIQMFQGFGAQSGASMPLLAIVFVPDKNVDKKIKKLQKYVNDILVDSKVPGLALGIVKDGKVILAEGFGYRNLEQKLPVTSKTLFAIGSCSKAFTTLAIGMLSEEGMVDWDEPVRTYLPSFTVKDSYISANMTVRDLVTHRSGLPRHDALWYGSTLSRKELFDRLKYLDFSAGFREKYQYNNLMFMTAGYLVGQVTNSTWEKFVADRIFKPLGMNNSNFSVEVSEKSSDFAQPYRINEKKVEKIPFRNIDEIGPAGSINSCIDDMLKWIQFHLEKGIVGEKQLVTESEMNDMHTPYMHIASHMSSNNQSHANYGLGWMISMYRGHKIVQHSGGIDGFTTSTSFLPFDHIGIFVVNNAASSISGPIAMYATDLLLDLEPIDHYAKMKESQKKAKEQESEKKEEERVEGTQPSHPLSAYSGQYEHPAYGVVTIEYKDDSLTGKFNSFEFPLEHFHYDVFQSKNEIAFRKMKLSFTSNLKGDIDKLAILLEPAVKKIVFTKKTQE